MIFTIIILIAISWGVAAYLGYMKEANDLILAILQIVWGLIKIGWSIIFGVLSVIGVLTIFASIGNDR